MNKITVIICTYNRCESLRDTLQALQRQVLEGGGWLLEIVVVDNNSSDETAAVIAQAASDSTWPIRYIFEGRQGISYARNRGISETIGEILAFTDDDVLPEVHWVQTLLDAFQLHQADCVGGKVLPKWQAPPPRWLAGNTWGDLGGMLALLDHGVSPLTMQHRDQGFIFGANMAFRHNLLKELGGFRVDLGARGTSALRGEDTEMVSRAFDAGKKIVYAPDAVVHHKVPPERMRKSYFRRWKFHSGRALAKYSGDHAGRLPMWALQECLTSGIAACGAYLLFRPDRYKKELAFLIRFGRVVGSLETMKLLPS